MKITSEMVPTTNVRKMSSLEAGQVFRLHLDSGSTKYVVLRKTKLFKGSLTPPTTGPCMVVMSIEDTGDVRDRSEGGGTIIEHSFKIFMGSELEMNVYPENKVTSLHIKMETEQ